MPEIASPRELFLHELGDILYVERELVEETLPKLIGEVQDAEFKKGLEKHLGETRQHARTWSRYSARSTRSRRPSRALGSTG